MAKEYSRTERVADYLQHELARLIQQEVRDPRLGLVSVNEARVSKDLSYAKVYVTFLDKDDEQLAQESLEVLNKAAGFLRSQIARSNHMRTTPRLQFVFDSSISHGYKLSSLIDQAVGEDAQRQKSRGSDSDVGTSTDISDMTGESEE